MWWMTAAAEVQSLFCERAKVLLTQPTTAAKPKKVHQKEESKSIQPREKPGPRGVLPDSTSSCSQREALPSPAV